MKIIIIIIISVILLTVLYVYFFSMNKKLNKKYWPKEYFDSIKRGLDRENLFLWNKTLFDYNNNSDISQYDDTLEFANPNIQTAHTIHLDEGRKIVIHPINAQTEFQIVTFNDALFKLPTAFHLHQKNDKCNFNCKKHPLDFLSKNDLDKYNIVFNKLRCMKRNAINNSWVINLERQPERFNYTINQLKKLNITPNKWPAVDAKNPEFIKKYKGKGHLNTIACFQSHLSLWKYLLTINNQEHFFIFEDDIFVPDEVTLNDIYKICDASVGFDLLFLGYCYGPFSFKTPDIKPATALCLHAYVVSKNGLKQLIKTVNSNDTMSDFVSRRMCSQKENLCIITKTVDYKKTKENIYGKGLIFQNRSLPNSRVVR